jgi:isoprenylcysteine carboxyl methyltransferase (ICMT) family protein YpbQ
MNHQSLDALRLELSLKAKNGVDFILAAAITWLGIAYLWTLPLSSYHKSVLTFTVGGLMLPLALLLSKVLGTTWTVKSNPLQPLGLWLNFAQLFYFPFLVFMLLKHPDYFVMTYVIITGAHFFPYAWYYNEKAYAVAAGVIAVGALLIGLRVPAESMYLVPLGMAGALLGLAAFIYASYRTRKNRQPRSLGAQG